MRAIALVALPVILAIAAPTVVDAKTPQSMHAKSKKKVKGKRVPVAFEVASAQPRTRIRNAQDPAGLTPLEFAKWLRAHPRLATDAGAIRNISTTTRLLNRSAGHFASADRNGDGRVSADELADFLQPEVVTPMRTPASTT